MSDHNVSSITDNDIVTGRDGGRGMANIIYILYIIGFFTGITALIGVILAYIGKDSAKAPYDSHFRHQIKIFRRGVVMLGVNLVLYMVLTAIAAMTFGVGFIFFLIPLGILIWWAVWTLLRIIKGMQALGQGNAI
ncbi:MAG: hypothetical protein ABJO27_09970 [Pseudoruegeria sp.]